MNNLLLWGGLAYLVFRNYQKAVYEIEADVKPVATPSGLSLKVTLTNPNLAAFYIDGAVIDISIGPAKIPVGRISITQPVFLGPDSSVDFIPVINTNTGGLTQVLSTLDKTKPVDIHVTGTVAIGPVDIPIDFTVAYEFQ